MNYFLKHNIFFPLRLFSITFTFTLIFNFHSFLLFDSDFLSLQLHHHLFFIAFQYIAGRTFVSIPYRRPFNREWRSTTRYRVYAFHFGSRGEFSCQRLKFSIRVFRLSWIMTFWGEDAVLLEAISECSVYGEFWLSYWP